MIILTWLHLHLHKLKMPVAISTRPSKKNQTQGGVNIITNKLPTIMSRIDKAFCFFRGLRGLNGLRGLYLFHSNTHFPSQTVTYHTLNTSFYILFGKVGKSDCHFQSSAITAINHPEAITTSALDSRKMLLIP